MNIEVKNVNGESLIKVAGCLDTTSSADFRRALDALPTETKKVTFDFAELEFISSSALRLLVMLAKRLNAAPEAIEIVGANEVVREVFDVTGLADVFTLR